MSNWTRWFFICVLSIFAMLKVEADVDFSKHKLSGVVKYKLEKRPFCNAFTGCGKKRAIYPPYATGKRSDVEEKPYLLVDNDMGEELSDLIDINAEPAVENVQKQIMSQAKIFEAIKEASKEIFRQKTKQKLLNQLRMEEQKQQHLKEQQYQQESNDQFEKIDDGETN